jgi:hypothetical protein
MAKTTKSSANQRLKKLIKWQKEAWQRPLTGLAALAAAQPHEVKEVNWNDTQIRARAAAAMMALSIERNDPTSEPLLKAFAAFDLDPTNPFDWRLLLGFFSFAHFDRYPKRGAPKQWNSDRWCRLLSDLDEARMSLAAKYPLLRVSDERACKELLEPGKFAKQYTGVKAKTLRRNLVHARDLQKNERLEITYRILLKKIEKLCFDNDLPLPSQDEARKLAKDLALDFISKEWRRCAEK